MFALYITGCIIFIQVFFFTTNGYPFIGHTNTDKETFIQCKYCHIYTTISLFPQDKQVQHVSDRDGMRDVSPPAAPRSRSQPAPLPARRRSGEHAPKRPQHPTRKAYNDQEPKPKHASRGHSHPPAPKVAWNDLPGDTKSSRTKPIFKSKVKQFLFNKCLEQEENPFIVP